MVRNLRKEVEDTRSEVTAAMTATVPSKDFGITVMLATIHLGLIEKLIRETNNLNERREKIHEFNRIKNAIGKGIKLLNKSQPGRRSFLEDQSKNLP